MEQFVAVLEKTNSAFTVILLKDFFYNLLEFGQTNKVFFSLSAGRIILLHLDVWILSLQIRELRTDGLCYCVSHQSNRYEHGEVRKRTLNNIKTYIMV